VKTIALLVLLVVPRLAAADIKVHESGGVAGAPTGAPAIVTFHSDERVVVRQITSESQAQVTSSTGATASGFADTSRALCTTPCKLEMPSGFMRIRFGDYNPMNANKAIDFNFRSGENTYRVRPFRGGKFVTGFLLAVVGGSAAITCGALGIVIAENRAPMLAIAGLGTGITIGGFVMMSGAQASAESIPVRDPSISQTR
jgi:hypothetical protein